MPKSGLCCADSEEEGRQIAHRYFRWSLAGWPVMAELPTPSAFAAASAQVTPQAVASQISCGTSAKRHLEAIGKYVDAGFDHIILNQVGPNQDVFFRLFERELAPALGERKAAA